MQPRESCATPTSALFCTTSLQLKNMTEEEDTRRVVDRFVHDKIDTVAHLEALLLLWNSRPKSWTPEQMAKGLYLEPDVARTILDDLQRQGLIKSTPESPGGYYYQTDADRDNLIGSVDLTYRRELIRITRLIHSKPSSAIRAFARAFRLKRDRD